MSIIQNNANVVSTCNQRILALDKYVKASTRVAIDGEQMKLSEVVAVYQASLDTRSAVMTNRTVYEKSLDARDSAEVARLATDKGLKAWVTSQFGAASQAAQDFGFLPPKIGAKSAATKAKAVEKLLATRMARGTKGKRQKEKIKGTIVAPAAPADPAATTQAAAPAASVPVSNGSSNVAPNGAPLANGGAGSR